MMVHYIERVPFVPGSTVGGLVGSAVVYIIIIKLLRRFFLLRHLNRRHICGYIIAFHYIFIQERPWDGLHANLIKLLCIC